MTMVTCSVDGTVRIFDGKTGEQVKVLEGHKSTVHDISYNSQTSKIVSCSEDGTCLVFAA